MTLDPPFWPALWSLAISARTRPEVLLTVWFAESELEPSAENPVSGCVGLNQTCPSGVGGPGFPSTSEAFKGSTASQQLAWIAPQVLSQVGLNGGGFGSAARYYQANFLPATLPLAKRPGDIIAARGGPYAAAYQANRDLDVKGGGAITLADLGDYLQRVYTTRGIDVDLGAPLEVAIHTAYASQNRPPNAPWTSPKLIIHEGAATRGGGAAVAGLIATAGLCAAMAFASRGHR